MLSLQPMVLSQRVRCNSSGSSERDSSMDWIDLVPRPILSPRDERERPAFSLSCLSTAPKSVTSRSSLSLRVKDASPLRDVLGKVVDGERRGNFGVDIFLCHGSSVDDEVGRVE